MSVTDLGRMLRKLRVDCDERQRDMARKLSVSGAFLSAVERGVKRPPMNMADKLVALYPQVDAAAVRFAVWWQNPDFRAGWNCALEEAARPTPRWAAWTRRSPDGEEYCAGRPFPAQERAAEADQAAETGKDVARAAEAVSETITEADGWRLLAAREAMRE